MTFNTKLLYTDVSFYDSTAMTPNNFLTTDVSGNISDSGIALTAKQDKILSSEFILSSGGWISYAQSATVTGVTSDNLVLVTSDLAEYAGYGVQCINQTTNLLSFYCLATPIIDLTVKAVMIS